MSNLYWLSDAQMVSVTPPAIQTRTPDGNAMWIQHGQ